MIAVRPLGLVLATGLVLSGAGCQRAAGTPDVPDVPDEPTTPSREDPGLPYDALRQPYPTTLPRHGPSTGRQVPPPTSNGALVRLDPFDPVEGRPRSLLPNVTDMVHPQLAYIGEDDS